MSADPTREQAEALARKMHATPHLTLEARIAADTRTLQAALQAARNAALEEAAKILDTRVAELAERVDHWSQERDFQMVQRCQTAGLTAVQAAKAIRALKDTTP